MTSTGYSVNMKYVCLDKLYKAVYSSFPTQGSYRSWKTWKVMELKYFSFQAWKVMEFNGRSWKVMENYSYVWYVNYCRSGSKDKINFRRVMSENTPNTRTILTIFETGS